MLNTGKVRQKELKDAYKELILKSLNPIPSLEQCRNILLTPVKTALFIKYKTGDIVLLHDEMRRLRLFSTGG